ncbi:DNA-directed primase/polymerase protein isoform X2 [Lampris incognitus]|uniref:DNA-directed primase/polymerase protein isoform X2 n=1 Tax=Lampris incognitus TaxID=2546036 RepID=UPI0024B56EC1|nr:DNA-directed primase/polymerase protein isoform X2 [Lampris incognitus]
MSKWTDRLKKVELLSQSFHQTPLTTRYKPRLWTCQPSSVWKLFPRQSMAIKFAQSCKEDAHIFALEKENTIQGQRLYLVTSYSELWHYYRTYRQSLMHCYEVIPEGAVCKLYFDLEFHRPSNKGLDGKAMVSFLIQYVCEKLMEVYGITCTVKDVLNLDSSTDEKFSRHLIFNSPHAAFKDNIHLGRFVHAIFEGILSMPKRGSQSNDDVNLVSEDNSPRIKDPAEACGTAEKPHHKRKRREERDLRCLLVKNKKGQECLFVDLGVYTKNRNFRLYKSTKSGKSAAFTVADDNEFLAKSERNISAEESLFFASLVCNMSFTGQRILTWDCPDTEGNSSVHHHHQQRSTTTLGLLAGYQYSPYQDVDNFVLTVIQKDGIQGSIRQWNYFVSEQLLVYDILKYRWCENVGRFHKSNNIMILVDLKEEVWYQKCHDPACKNFRSSSYPLPQEICTSHLMKMDEEDQTYLMDDAGNIELSQASGHPLQSAAHPEEKVADVWGDEFDDDAYVEALDDFETQREAEFTDNIPDQLLLQCMAEFDAK